MCARTRMQPVADDRARCWNVPGTFFFLQQGCRKIYLQDAEFCYKIEEVCWKTKQGVKG